jgi:hypothetical protein
MGDHNDDPSRRAFVKKAAYVAPVIVSLEAMPVFASSGSDWSKDEKEAAKEAEKAAKDAAKEAAKEAEKAAKDAAKEAAKEGR